MTRAVEEVDAVFVALGDPTRRLLLERLGVHGEATATRLAAELPVSRQAVVKHLGVLNHAGLVTGRRQGKEMRYAVRPDRLTATARWLTVVATEWDRRLAAIRRLAETGPA